MMRALSLAFWRLFRFIQVLIVTPILVGGTLVFLLIGAAVGAVVATPLVFAFFDQAPGESLANWLVLIPCMVIGAVVGVAMWFQISGAETFFGNLVGVSHGSARFAGKRELKTLEQAKGLLIGRNPRTGKLLSYDGPAHLLTLAPTRAGKGVGTVIPNLLAADRSVLVIDPKGENARIAGAARERFGTVHVLDPFEVSGRSSASYNPLDRLSADSPDLSEDAKALIGGLIMFCAAHEEPERRNLGSVREYLTLPPDRLKSLLELMQESEAADGLIARAANRFVGKAEREAASVLSNAQRHTHFLDSPRIAKCMARSDFTFSDLRHRITSVFLVLPPNRLDAYSRWLRLLVSQALQDIARDAERPQGASEGRSERLKAPALFLLDEFAALGRLEAVERAMGLMAGYGLQLWPILQDMSQLRDLYGQRAATFVANAGVQQVFGVNDYDTAKWLSQTMGQETIGYQTESRKPGDMPTTGIQVTGRDLLTPDEIMQLPPELQLLRVQGQATAVAQKLRYYADPEFAGLFTPDAR